MATKVYIHYKEAGKPEKSSKIGIPSAWMTKTAADMAKLFLTAYNKEHPGNTLVLEEVHLEGDDGVKIYNSDVIGDFLSDRSDYYVKHGAHVKPSQANKNDGRPRCKNYGCNQPFTEDENNDNACQHHTGPPIFHDTMKCWSCCTDRKAFDFESFQEIKGCCFGRHSMVEPHVVIAPSPTAGFRQGGSGKDNEPTTVLKSIEQYNVDNASAVTAASSAVKTLKTRTSTRKADGTARCQRPGCQKVFEVSGNHGSACTFHRGQAVFHDTAKFWSCCPDRKCYDFDDFLKIQGCAVGCHDDGEIDLE